MNRKEFKKVPLIILTVATAGLLSVACSSSSSADNVKQTAVEAKSVSENTTAQSSSDESCTLVNSESDIPAGVTKVEDFRQNRDGQWECNGNTYKNCFIITGRMPSADKDSTFVYLSNLDQISFEEAYKAAGISNDLNDYFDVKDAVYVALK